MNCREFIPVHAKNLVFIYAAGDYRPYYRYQASDRVVESDRVFQSSSILDCRDLLATFSTATKEIADTP